MNPLKAQISLNNQIKKLEALGYPDAPMTAQIRSVLAHVSMARKRLEKALADAGVKVDAPVAPEFFAPNRRANGNITWCGPYALAVVAETTYEDQEKIVVKRRLSKSARSIAVRGMYNSEIEAALTEQGIGFTRDFCFDGDTGQYPTLAKWLRTNTKGTWIVQVTGHYVVVRDGKIIDNQMGEWKPCEERKKYRRHRVNYTYKIEG